MNVDRYVLLRWLHKSWKIFWRLILAVLLLALIVSGAVVGLLQFDTAQDYLVDRVEQQVEQNYEAELTIGDLDGVLPFSLALHDVVLTDTDSTRADTLAKVEYLEGEVDIWSLLQNRVSVTNLTVAQPRVWLRMENSGRVEFLHRSKTATRSGKSKEEQSWFSDTEYIAPAIEVVGGAVYMNSLDKQLLNLPSTFGLTGINADFFFEWSEQQRFLDIESFSSETQNLSMKEVSFSGQVYNDDQLVELNSFDLSLGDSQFNLNGEINGVHLYQSDFLSQLSIAQFNLSVVSNRLNTRELKGLIPYDNVIEEELHFEFETEGTVDSLMVTRALVGIEESTIQLEGLVKDIFHPESLGYALQVESNNIRPQDLQQVTDGLGQQPFSFEDFSFGGKIEGTLDSLSTEVDLSGSFGGISIQGGSQLKEPYQYRGSIAGVNVNLDTIVPEVIDSTSLTFDIRIDGYGFKLRESYSDLEATFSDSKINNTSFENLEITSTLDEGLWSQNYRYNNQGEALEGSGWINFKQEKPALTIKGDAENINVAKLFGGTALATTQLDFGYNIEARGLKPDNIEGRANVDIQPSIINGDTVRAHQLYMDLGPPGQENRSFRLTSSLFDMNISGQLVPSYIINQAKYWKEYLSNRFKTEILMNTSTGNVPNLEQPKQSVVLNGAVTAKDLSLIRKYLPGFPKLDSDSQVSFDVNTNGNRLLFSAEMEVDTLQYNQWSFGNGSTQLTASFKGDRSLKDFATIDMESNIGKVASGGMDFRSVAFDLSMKQDSLYYSQKIGGISDNARFNMTLNSVLSDTSISTEISNFFLGNEEYAWINRESPSLIFKRSGEVEFSDFRFQNKSEFFEMKGTMSSDRKDSLAYNINNVHLDRISSLIDGKISFGGILNGNLITKSLTRQPTIQGELIANRFTLNNRTVGDVSFNSQFNPREERFDTEIEVTTDSLKYESYLEENDGIGQNMALDGYFVTPRPEVNQDTVYHFDADFQQIDMWVIPLLVDNIFEEMEGQATGDGYITGNLQDFDFHADFQTENIFVKPRFVETNYFVSGPVSLDRQEGVVLDSINVIDTKGGSGTVWGVIDLNDFNPITYLDLTADMDQLQFLNSSFDPDIPFYGNVSGSGRIRLTGTNTDLYMRTENPVELSSDSDISIPLMEQTELSESRGFIQFVDSFEGRDQHSLLNTKRSTDSEEISEEELEAEIQEMTFSERFDLDLQFTSTDDITVHLVFDPVTGEVLTSQGTGQMRLTMQDQDVQMFGRYNINDGTYQFVTGEIISRRLELESGGTIVWEGPPDNARLDISAVFNARPNISTLTSERALDAQNQNGQQVPIDLIVEINGTLNSVENNYFFRLPPSLDLSSSSTLTYTINQINRDEQQKLLQATSILFTGQFIPTQGVGNATATLGENLSKGSTVLNPLLSNQVISPLLSNQINALLNSDVSRFDVDFNLNAYNEVDLGIAFRLYNDRLVLRREGQITGGGPQSTVGDRIGDLNATYRIQRGLSLTAFHRQDQILGSLGASGTQAGDVTPSVDGIGIETQVQFNSWKGLLNKISNIFGSNSKQERNSEADLTDHKAIEKKQE